MRCVKIEGTTSLFDQGLGTSHINNSVLIRQWELFSEITICYIDYRGEAKYCYVGKVLCISVNVLLLL